MTIYDSHFHLDHKNGQTVTELTGKLRSAGIAGGMLILNTPEDKRVFLENTDPCRELKTATLIAPDSEDDLLIYEQIKVKTGSRTVKIHPRISDLCCVDFEKVAASLKGVDFTNIIVDAFYYGHTVRNHIGTELAIYLAEIFSDKKITIAHSGGHKILECMLYTRGVRNIYYDLSLTPCYLAGTSVEKDIIHFIRFNFRRIMFGSDHPDFPFETAIEKTISLCEAAGCTSEQIEMIMGGNYCEIYGN